MKKIWIVLIVLTSVFHLSAQNIEKLEFFFDQDPGFGNASTISLLTPGMDINEVFDPQVGTLENGFHTLYFRVQDENGDWSHTSSLVFNKENNISELSVFEYWYDEDPGYNAGTHVELTNIANVTVPINIDATTISGGLHQLYYRLKDVGGVWGQTYSTNVVKESSPFDNPIDLVQVEFFVDTDPGYGNGQLLSTSILPQTTDVFDFDLSSISSGIHNGYLRLKDENGVWGMTYCMPFVKEVVNVDDAAELTTLEYFFNEDPGFGSGHQVPTGVGANQNIAFTADLTSAISGLNVLYIRAQDEHGKWSHVQSTLVLKQNNAAGFSTLQEVEWYIDMDPGFGNGNAVDAPLIENGSFGFTADISGLSNGVHTLFTRQKDSSGDWGQTTPHVFVKEVNGINDSASSIEHIEWFVDEDPGFGNGFDIEVDPSVENISETYQISLPDLIDGSHTLYFRAQDSRGAWSIVQAWVIDYEFICLGDFNGDMMISGADLLTFLGELGCTSNCITDLNGDTVVTGADLLIFLGVFGTNCGS